MLLDVVACSGSWCFDFTSVMVSSTANIDMLPKTEVGLSASEWRGTEEREMGITKDDAVTAIL